MKRILLAGLGSTTGVDAVAAEAFAAALEGRNVDAHLLQVVARDKEPAFSGGKIQSVEPGTASGSSGWGGRVEGVQGHDVAVE